MRLRCDGRESVWAEERLWNSYIILSHIIFFNFLLNQGWIIRNLVKTTSRCLIARIMCAWVAMKTAKMIMMTIDVRQQRSRSRKGLRLLPDCIPKFLSSPISFDLPASLRIRGCHMNLKFFNYLSHSSFRFFFIDLLSYDVMWMYTIRCTEYEYDRMDVWLFFSFWNVEKIKKINKMLLFAAINAHFLIHTVCAYTSECVLSRETKIISD